MRSDLATCGQRPVPWLRGRGSRFSPLLGVLSLAVMLGLACQGAPGGETYFTDGDDQSSNDASDAGDADGDTTTGGDDGGPEPVFECTPGQIGECGAGFKCAALSNGGAQNKYSCVEDDAELIPLAPCTPSPDDGQDGCPDGTACAPAIDQGVTGLCLPLCSDDDDCGDGECVTDLVIFAAVCAAPCDPLSSDCEGANLVCRPEGSDWVCRHTGAIDVGGPKDECDGLTGRGCAAGHACALGSVVPECGTTFCCTPLCDLSGVDDCAGAASCVGYSDMPLPGLEDLGLCIVAQ